MDTKKENTDVSLPRSMGRVRMSYLLFLKSFDLLQKSPQVLLFGVFPVLLRFLVIVLSVILSVVVWPTYSVFLLIFFFVTLFTSLSETGIMVSVDEDMDGKKMEFKDALAFVFYRSDSIFLWSFFAAMVEILLLALAIEFGLLGGVFVIFAWVVWEFGTFYVVSAIVAEKSSLSTTLESSFGTIKKNWPETFLVNGVFGFFLMWVFIAIALLLLILSYLAKFGLLLVAFGPYGIFAPPILLIIHAFFGFVFLLLFSVAHSIFIIFNIVLYRYTRGDHKDFFHAVTPDSYRDKK